MTFTIILSIVLVIAITALVLSAQADNERAEREAREREQAIQNHLAMVRRKYAGDDPSKYRSRNHADFTGEKPLSPSRLAAVKQSILKEGVTL